MIAQHESDAQVERRGGVLAFKDTVSLDAAS